MFSDFTVKMLVLLNNIIIMNINIFIVGVLSLFYIIVGTTLCMICFVLESINTIEYPLFIRCRQFVKRFVRMMFWCKTYKRVGYDEEAIRRGDSYIDKILEDLFENNEKEYDPYVLEDSVVGFSKKVMFVNVTGEVKLHDGYIRGLSTLHRPQHCSLHREGDKLRVKADLGAGVLDFIYKGSAKFMNFGPTITVQGTLSYIEVHMEFKVNSKTGREGKLTKFIIDDMRGMKIQVRGLGPLNWAVNPIISGVTKIFKRFVRNFMENKVENHIREHIPNYQFPVEGGENTEVPETDPTETEKPEGTTAPDTLPPKTETPEETREPETEATSNTETESPEETSEPEPETEVPEEETPAPETEAPEENLEKAEEINLPKNKIIPETLDSTLDSTFDSSIIDETDEDESEAEESESSELSSIPDSDVDSEKNFI